MFKIKPFAVLLPALMAIALMAAPLYAQSVPAAAPTGEAAQTTPLAAPTGSVDVVGGERTVSGLGGISISGLFMHAGPLVKVVLLLLLAASIWTWMIIFNKWLAMSRLHKREQAFERVFWSGRSLDELYSQFSSHNNHPFTAVFLAGFREWHRAFEKGGIRQSQLAGIKDRVAKAMNITISRELDVIQSQLGFLASVASTAPFVGLFGTVWGIMNSFAAIAARHDTTLAVVAPGIAEALCATAMGLMAAIPAAFFYNTFVGSIGRYGNQLDTFADELSGILSYRLDEKAE